MIWRFLPLTGVLLLFVVAGGWRPWLQRRRYGTSGIVLFRSDTPGQNRATACSWRSSFCWPDRPWWRPAGRSGSPFSERPTRRSADCAKSPERD